MLLSGDEVSQIAQGTFTAKPDDESDDSSTGCTALDEFTQSAKNADKVKAGRQYSTSDETEQAAEQLTFIPARAESLFSKLKGAVTQCDSFDLGDSQLAVKPLSDPSVDGADDTLALGTSGDISGQAVNFDFYFARFGDNVVQVFYGGAVDESTSSTVGEQLLQKAAEKAKPAVS